MNLTDLGRLTDDEARNYLESIRWPNGPVCPHCGSTDCTRLQGKAHRPVRSNATPAAGSSR